MMTIETTAYPAVPAKKPTRPASPLARMSEWLARERKRRTLERSYGLLLEADDRMLRDVGIARHEVARLLDGVRRG